MTDETSAMSFTPVDKAKGPRRLQSAVMPLPQPKFPLITFHRQEFPAAHQTVWQML